MVYSRIKLIIRIVILAGAIFLVSYLIFAQNKYVQAAYAGGFALFVIAELFYYLNKTNTRIKQFFNSIYWDDFNISLQFERKGKISNELHKTLSIVAEKLQYLRRKNLSQLSFIETLVKHAKIGLISIDKENNINFINHAFEQSLLKARKKRVNSVNDINPALWEQIKLFKPGESKNIQITTPNKIVNLYCLLSTFIIDNEEHKLFSIQNIDTAVDETEIKTWKKLIRILTHEIMNSVSPIVSLSDSLSDIMKEEDINSELYSNRIIDGLGAINNRSAGLMKFTNSFQALTKIPDPEIQTLDTTTFCNKIKTLFFDQLSEKNIDLAIEILPMAESFSADEYLMEQVFINLIKNAMDALDNVQEPKIKLTALKESNCTVLEMMDNGTGIKKDALEQIFVPFFTTKERGNGIGLALCKQIVNMHKGEILVHSEVGKGTTFKLVLPAD